MRDLEDEGGAAVGRRVDTDLFHPSRRSLAMRVRLSDGCPDGPVLLYVGPVSPEGNLELLGDALDALPGTRLAVVGEGPARADLERRWALKPVAFLGPLRGPERARACASADVFVVPRASEAVRSAVLEAMGSGCPVVAARAHGVPDLVENSQTGLLFDPARPEQAFAQIRELIERPCVARFYARQGRKAAESLREAAPAPAAVAPAA